MTKIGRIIIELISYILKIFIRPEIYILLILITSLELTKVNNKKITFDLNLFLIYIIT